MRARKAKVNGEQELFWMESSGFGEPVILCHGWPEFWYCWRHQIEALKHRYRVIAIDARGYGQSSCPPKVEDYTLENITGDLVGLLDYLKLEKAVFIGHDWGGAVVWSMAFHFPERVRAVASVNTPYVPSNPNKNPIVNFGAVGTPFNYQLYFQKPGVAEAEFEKDLKRTFTILLRSSHPEDRIVSPTPNLKLSTSNVTVRGGMFVGMPENLEKSWILNDDELEYYVENYKRSGFRGPINWYRNIEANWKWNSKTAHVILPSSIPALMVTTGKDTVLRPEMTRNMEKSIPHLERGHIEECAHWTQMEAPEELNDILLNWLNNSVFPQTCKL